MLALGTANGSVVLVTLLLHRSEAPFWAPLVVGSAHHHVVDRSVNREDLLDVVSLQFDEDKLVSVGRSGKLRVSRLRSALGSAATVSRLSPVSTSNSCVVLAPGEPTDLMRCVRYQEAAARECSELRLAEEFSEEDFADLMYWKTSEMGANLGAFPVWDRGVRCYVSTVCFGGGVLVHDGLDDKVLVSFCGLP